jgi:predicted transport protein
MRGLSEVKKLQSFNNFDKETTVKALRRFSKAVGKVGTPCEDTVEVYLETLRNCDDHLIYIPAIVGLMNELKADEIRYDRDSNKLTFRWD